MPALSSSTLQSSFLRLQRAFTPTHGQKKKKKNGAQQSIKNIGQTRVSDSFALSTNFLLG